MTHTYGHQQDAYSASEEYFYSVGSHLYCDPKELENWKQAVSVEVAAISQPSDTCSEAATSEYSTDYLDMSGLWTPSSMSGDWTTVPAQDNSTMAQNPAGEWSSQGAPVTSQGLHALDAAAWLDVPQESVVSGSSPVLSHESQSAYTLPSVSEPEPFALPSSWDFTFTAQPQWNHSGPFVYNNSPAVSSPASGYGPVTSFGPNGFGPECNAVAIPPLYPGAQPPMFFPQNGQDGQQRQPVSLQQLFPMRPLLPRTDSGATTSAQSAQEARRVERPSIQGSRSSDDVLASVSNVTGRSRGMAQRTNHPAHSTGYSNAVSHHAQHVQYSNSGAYPTPLSLQPALVSYGPAVPDMSIGPNALSGNPASMFHLAQEDQNTTPRVTSYAHGFDTGYPGQANAPNNFNAGMSYAGQEVTPVPQGSQETAQAVPMEREEAKYRTHEHYASGPQADGLYHCPFVDQEPSCRHKPVKLKCSYDKYIDSHLKPFVCKIETCGEQKFSSTACLLRHEREAHGMHGHGERPHHCLYHGCDRAVPGNGFPRRFNAYDHMKRVHGYVGDNKESGQRRRKVVGSSQRPRAVRPQTQQPSRGGGQPMSRSQGSRPPQRQWSQQGGSAMVVPGPENTTGASLFSFGNLTIDEQQRLSSASARRG